MIFIITFEVDSVMPWPYVVVSAFVGKFLGSTCSSFLV